MRLRVVGELPLQPFPVAGTLEECHGCDFGYADWPADGNGTELPTTADPNALEQVTHSQAWSENTG